MGEDIHVHIVRHSKTDNLFHPIVLYVKNSKDEFEPVSAYDSRNYDIFEQLKHYDIPSSTIDFSSLESNFSKDIKNAEEEFGCYSFKEINLADLKIYCTSHPIEMAYDDNAGEEVPIENPLCDFLKAMERYIDICELGYPSYSHWSDYKIIYYFDH